MFIEVLPELLLFRGFLQASFKNKLKRIALYPFALVLMIAWLLYNQYIQLYFMLSERKLKRKRKQK